MVSLNAGMWIGKTKRSEKIQTHTFDDDLLRRITKWRFNENITIQLEMEGKKGKRNRQNTKYQIPTKDM